MAGREYKFINSSNLKGVSYDANAKVLYIQFNNNSEYAYHDVPEDEYENLISDPSPGGYLNDSIKGAYNYTRV